LQAISRLTMPANKSLNFKYANEKIKFTHKMYNVNRYNTPRIYTPHLTQVLLNTTAESRITRNSYRN